MKIADAISFARKSFDAKNINSSALDAQILLIFATSFTKEKIVFNPDLELSSSQEKIFLESVARRVNREPVSHIIGKREFFGAEFLVNKDVLDPRPDSESLIELVLKSFTDAKGQLKILELGSGSGCLIITLLKNYCCASVIAVDISLEALEVCKKNAIANQVEERLKLVASDLFFNLIADQKFDLIISNPPYIPSNLIDSLELEVKIYEPKIALDGGLDGLNFYRRIAAEAKNFLKPQGKIILEIGFGQELDVIEIFTKSNFTFIESKSDLSGVIRVLSFY